MKYCHRCGHRALSGRCRRSPKRTHECALRCGYCRLEARGQRLGGLKIPSASVVPAHTVASSALYDPRLAFRRASDLYGTQNPLAVLQAQRRLVRKTAA